jgi:hypothetical protein
VEPAGLDEDDAAIEAGMPTAATARHEDRPALGEEDASPVGLGDIFPENTMVGCIPLGRDTELVREELKPDGRRGKRARTA